MGDESDELLRRALALSVDQREALARALWSSVEEARAAEAEASQSTEASPVVDPEPAVDPAVARRRREWEADARCLRFGHLDREVDYCANPNCPSRRPEVWEAYRSLAALRSEGDLD